MCGALSVEGGKMMFCKHLDKPLEFVQNITGDPANMAGGKRSVWKCPDCGKIIYRQAPFIQGQVSDGYHTFDELYNHRTLLFSAVCNGNKDVAWKSKKHHDGTMYGGMFIAGIETPYGQATYHCEMPYWDCFDVKELENAPEFDGHTPDDAIDRIYRMGKAKV